MQSISDTLLIVGNDAQLLVDGPKTHRAMFAAMSEARTQINLESYILEDVQFESGTNLSGLLLAKRAQGVEVNVIYDAIGSSHTPKSFFEKLRAGGVNCCEFNPVMLPWKLNHRDHRKILVVDGSLAFTGGINLSSAYSSGSFGLRKRRKEERLEDGWRDTHIAVRGPAAFEFQKLFLDTWQRQACAKPDAKQTAAQPAAAGDKVLRVIGSSPDNNASEMYLALLAAIEHAESQIYITMAYFVPDPNTIAALKRAAERGVDVKLILPGFSDFWAVFHAGRSHYSDLLRSGVRIYEQRDALLHAKTAVIDGVWSTVGSTNMDWRSYMHNDEVNAIVLGEDFGRTMLAMFEGDLAVATPIDPARWERRSRKFKFKEWFARRWEYLL